MSTIYLYINSPAGAMRMLPSGDVLPLSRHHGPPASSESGAVLDIRSDVDTHRVRRAHSMMGGISPFSSLVKRNVSASGGSMFSESPLPGSRVLASVTSGVISQGGTPDSRLSFSSERTESR